ncbi:MAG: NAD(P)-dependent alcohol dehydrogenase [Synechococcus sp.]
MKAIVLTEYGSSDVLQLADVDKPIPGDDEVLINVRATSVNDWDWCLRRGKPYYIRLLCGLRKPNIRIPGAEVAGVIESVGINVTKFQPGDAVYGDISECGFSGFAEYVCVPESALALKPEQMSFTDAAAIPHAGMLALQGLVDVGQLKPGQSVLINGAGGGVGTLGVQIAKSMGVDEISGVDSGDKADMMRSLGFTQTIDYTQEDFTQSEKHYDLILDTKTNRSIFDYLRVLKPNGMYVTVGGFTPQLFQPLLLGPLIGMVGKKRAQIVTLKPNQNLEFFNDLFEAGKIAPIVDGPYSFEDIPKAIQYFGEGKHKGKVVISLDGNSKSLN